MEHQGYILIADITGYTVYLNESELDHARGTLSSLLELLIEHTKPPLVVSGLEGDAVFSYGLEEGFINAQTFIETIENTYVSFRRAIELMVLNNTCQCNACANVSTLDLKFFVHHGTFALQQVGDGQELMGRDINLIHRLLKNSVTDATGIRAYMLCTDAARKSLGLEEENEGLVRHVEKVSDFGEITVWVKDMHPIYEARQATKIIEFEPSEIIWSHEVEIALPADLIWNYLTHTEFRNLISASDRFEVTQRQSGRIGEGTVYQCYHGDRAVAQVVLEWRPFERIVVKQANPLPGPISYIHIALSLTESEAGTILSSTGGKPTGKTWQRACAWLIYKAMNTSIMKRLHEPYSFRRSLERFRDAIEDHTSGIAGETRSSTELMQITDAGLSGPTDYMFRRYWPPTL